VPFLQKDPAKAMGMRIDGVRKLWFAERATLALAASASFRKVHEPDPRDIKI
jgi:Domain of unknown function (DUF5710)